MFVLHSGIRETFELRLFVRLVTDKAEKRIPAATQGGESGDLLGDMFAAAVAM